MVCLCMHVPFQTVRISNMETLPLLGYFPDALAVRILDAV